MRKIGTFWIVGVVALLLAGCGSSDPYYYPPPPVGPGFVGIEDLPNVAVTAPLLKVSYFLPAAPNTVIAVEIFSDQPADGDIAFYPAPAPSGQYVITMGPGTVFFGIDSLAPGLPEYRAFLDFPLGSIPLNAVIVSSTLDLFVNTVSFSGVIPIFLDLVPYSPAGLVRADFDRTPLAFRTLDFFASDLGNYVLIDVTSLMQEAQRSALADFQVRFSLNIP